MKSLYLASYAIFVPLLTYTSLSKENVLILSFLLLIDIATAILREWVIDPKKIQSRILCIGLISKLMVWILPFVIIIAGKGANIDLSKLGNISLSVFIVAEAYSIIGNVIQIRARDKTIYEYDAITLVLRETQHFLRKMLEKMVR